MRMFILSVVLFFVAGAAQAATLNVVAGELRGASGVDVGGNFYDVQFLDGTCIDLFNGCDEASDFTFNSLASATLASQALSDQVFLDGAEGNFDSQSFLTRGCLPFLGVGCFLFTPFNITNGTGVVTSYLLNQSFDSIDDVGELNLFSYSILTDPSSEFPSTWALFSPATPVPEPSTALLLVLGLTGLAGKGRRRNRS
jgi:hypothetical protein